MNQYVPDWSSNMGDAFAPLGGEDDGLMELLWCNGNVIMQSQAPRKPARPEKPAMQEDDAVSWFQCPADDPLDKDLFSEMFGEMPDAGKACKEEEECGAAVLMPPPPRPAEVPWEKPGFGEVVEGTAATETDESSMVTVGSRSICGSNKFQTPGAARARVVSDINDGNALPPLGGGKATAARGHHDVSTVTSSSMRSRPCFAKTEQHGTSNLSGGKRKQRDTMEPRSSIEDVEFESAAETREPTQKVTTTKRRRAAEVHNLSERRRRDRINEKMKALQQLIPHSNKTDKASMLDEAIEYLKSLQLQVQMMWMGGGMTPAPMMFPAGVHQYMQRMGVGMGAPHLASLPSMPPFVASMGVQSSPASHLPAAVSMADTYARCLSVQRLQPPSPMYLQGMSVYQLGAAKNLHQKSRIQPRHRLPAATARALPPDDVLHRKYENCSIPEEMMLISS